MQHIQQNANDSPGKREGATEERKRRKDTCSNEEAVHKVHTQASSAHCAFHFKLHAGAGGSRTPSEAAGCIIPLV